MWKAAILFLTFRLYGISGGNIYRNEWAQVQTLPVNQPSYYSQFGPLLHDVASYQEKLYQQGLAPSYGQDLNPPFILTNNAAIDNYNPNPFDFHHETSVNNHKRPSYHQESNPAKRPPCTKQPVHPTKEQGKHKLNFVRVDKKKENENAKHPYVIVYDYPGEVLAEQVKKANKSIVSDVSATVNKISGEVEKKVSAIKEFIDQTVDNINKTADGVYQQISDDSSWLIGKINRKLKSIEKHLERLKFGTVKRIDDWDFAEDDDDEDDEALGRSIANNPSEKPNVVHSDIGKKLRSMELLSLDAELRGDLKTSISDAVRGAQDKFNKLIDDQVAKINNKIADVSSMFDGALKKFQDSIAKIPAPVPAKLFNRPTSKPSKKYEPSSHIELPPYIFPEDAFTTPEYFKFTVPNGDQYKQDVFALSNTLIADLNRMDANVDSLEIVDDAEGDSAKSNDDSESGVAAEEIDNKAPMNDDKEKDLKLDDELKIDVDTAKSLDDLQSQVLANVKDTLKSDGGDLEAIGNNQSEVLENPEDKLKSDMAESDDDTEMTLTEELRGEVEGKLLAENSEAKNSDDLTEKADEIDDESSTTAQLLDDFVNALRIDEDVADDDSVDDLLETSIDNSEDSQSQVEESNQVGSFRFDELEIIQLIPVIIEQLRRQHVSESEQLVLEKVFGDLWPILIAEASRKDDEEMNPVLRTIIESEEVRLAKRDIKKQIGNDIYKNSIRRVYRGSSESSPKPYLALDDDRKLLSPSERLLKMVAAIVHKANEKRSSEARITRQKQKRRNVRKKSGGKKHPLGIVSVEKPRQRFVDRILSINRIKRSIVKFTTDLEDMKTFLEQVNQASNSEEGEEAEVDVGRISNEHLDDYVDDDYYYYDDDYQMSPESGYPLNKLSWSQRNYFDDYESGSVNEFIQLAKQRDRREKSESFEDNYEDDDDDDYEN